MEYAHYLIAEKHAKVTDPRYRDKNYPGDNPNDKFYPVNDLRDWIYPLDSDKYKKKIDIVNEFSRQGVDYWKAEITEDQLRVIKKRHPDTWQEYINKY